MYEGERLLGELDVVRQDGVVSELKEIRISHFSPPSERCPPLAVLHTINNAVAGMCLKLESTVKNLLPDSPLSVLHATCLRDNKVLPLPLPNQHYTTKKIKIHTCRLTVT